MMRIFFAGLLLLTAGFLFLQGRLMERNSEKPVFLSADKIAQPHRTTIRVSVKSAYRPDSQQLVQLKQDYSNLWAHLNHLYSTNDVLAGKEYYTENWFRQICGHFRGLQTTAIARSDESHELIIENWASDALVCSVVDSNLVFRYRYPDKTERLTRATVAMVLLFQGDHWRVDAMRVISEKTVSE